MNDKSVNLLTLFASSSSLICCAIPAIFITLGAGAAFANLILVFPFLIILSKYKVYISALTFIIITLAGYINYKVYLLPCPTDPELGKICMKTRKNSRYIYYFSVMLFIFATIFTYIAPRFI
tara:strand:+ start:425 stop:790 length:366 start_codon:yes stop_codon:yes gene_type:complete